VDTLLLERTRTEEAHTADLLVQLDTAVSLPFLFNYSGRTLTAVVPGSPGAGSGGPSSTGSSDDSDGAMIAVVILIIIIVIGGVLLYLRDVRNGNNAASSAEPVAPPVKMLVSADGKPYWRDETATDIGEDNLDGGKSGAGIEESAIDDMTNPRRTTLEYQNPIAVQSSGAIDLPATLAGFDYVIRPPVSAPRLPFTFPTAFPVPQLVHRSEAMLDREFTTVGALSEAYRPNTANFKYLDDYKLPRGLLAAKATIPETIPWDMVWESDCTVVVVMASKDEVGDAHVPAQGTNITSADQNIMIQNSGTAMLTETLMCSNLILRNSLESGQERMVQALQITKWDPSEQSMEQDLIDMLIAAKQSHYANDGSKAVIFDSAHSKGRPSSGAFLLAWIAVKSALDTGLVDLSRTALLLEAQEKGLIRDRQEYGLVYATLRRMLLTIPSMADAQLSQSQQLCKMCLQTWHATLKTKQRNDMMTGYIDVSSEPLGPAYNGAYSQGGYLDTSAAPVLQAPQTYQTYQTPALSAGPPVVNFPEFPDFGVPPGMASYNAGQA
jgi:hypothetical protein